MQTIAAQISFNAQNSSWSGIWVLFFVGGFVLWLIELVSLLKRQDIKDVDKIVWTIVLCTLNVLGLLLYWFMAPGGKKGGGARSEKELKDYFNSRADRSDE